jgi:hypothetical protein
MKRVALWLKWSAAARKQKARMEIQAEMYKMFQLNRACQLLIEVNI